MLVLLLARSTRRSCRPRSRRSSATSAASPSCRGSSPPICWPPRLRPAVRQARRPVRRKRSPDRDRHLPDRVGALRPRAEDGAADRVPRVAGPRRRWSDGHRRSPSSATSSRRANGGGTRATSAPSSASRPSSGRCSAASSSTTSRGAGSSTSTCRSAIALVIADRSTRPEVTRQHTIDYLGAALLAASLGAIVLFTSLGGTTWAWGSPRWSR